MENFRKLRVWQSAKEIAVKTYLLTRESELSKDFGLMDQIQRSAVSIASNIAEGDELGSDRLPLAGCRSPSSPPPQLINCRYIKKHIHVISFRERRCVSFEVISEDVTASKFEADIQIPGI